MGGSLDAPSVWVDPPPRQEVEELLAWAQLVNWPTLTCLRFSNQHTLESY